MALSRAAVHLLVREAARRPFEGTVLTMGRQHVYVTLGELKALANRYGVSLKNVEPRIHRDPNLAAAGFLADDSLFELLGFTQSVRLDYSSYEAAEHVFDLNSPQLPSELTQQFDLVLDSGTIEHVFDIAMALRHCAEMLKPGGRVVHLTPSSNCVEHGFYSVSPTLFADFYSASRFTLESLYLCRVPRDLLRGVWQTYDYLKAPNQFIPIGMLSGDTWFTFCVATREPTSHAQVPQQSFYASAWNKHGEATGEPAASKTDVHAPPGSRAALALGAVSRSRTLTRIVRGVISLWRKAINAWRLRRGTPPYPEIGQL